LNVILLLLLACAGASAERLATRTYITGDGLPGNPIRCIRRDSRGFLWFCTSEGLARFDGYQFSSYTTDTGLPNRIISDLLETRDHTYLLATSDGVVLFDPLARNGKPKFVVYRLGPPGPAKYVYALLEDSSGNVWCATAGGLYRLDRQGPSWTLKFVDIGMPAKSWSEASAVTSLLEDKRGGLWLGTSNGLYRRWPNGEVERYTSVQGFPAIGSTLSPRTIQGNCGPEPSTVSAVW